MRRDELVALYHREPTADARARALCMDTLAGMPLLVGMLYLHTPDEIAALALAVIRRRARRNGRGAAVTVVEDRVYLERPADAKPHTIAMVVNRHSHPIDVAEALAEFLGVA